VTPTYQRLSAGRREQVLDAGNGLFAERGYEEVSIEDFANWLQAR
jgi:AcrR family transcriptional regulator